MFGAEHVDLTPIKVVFELAFLRAVVNAVFECTHVP